VIGGGLLWSYQTNLCVLCKYKVTEVRFEE
jgi:hypothetical protein